MGFGLQKWIVLYLIGTSHDILGSRETKNIGLIYTTAVGEVNVTSTVSKIASGLF